MSRCKGKLLLIVNVASRWGYTDQYKHLESLYNDYKNRNFEILAFPCNQFGAEEPKSNQVIKAFVKKNYNVTFPMFSKIDVNKQKAHPIFLYLRQNSSLQGKQIDWNFRKFLVSKTGDVIETYRADVEPFAMRSDIEANL